MPKNSTDITAKYTNSFCKSMFAEWAIGLIVYILAIALSINHSISLPIGSAVMFLSYNLLFTSMHAAGHKHFSRNISRYEWMDRVIGEVSGSLIQISHKRWAKRHNEHHKHTNIRDMDPDFLPKFKFRTLFLYVILATLIRAIFAIPFMGKRIIKTLPSNIRQPWESQKEKKLFIHTDSRTRITYAIILTTILGGYGAYGFWLIFLPFILHSYVMVIIFSWLPHRSRKSEEYQNTRDQITPLLNRTAFLIGADFHLEHHLHPSVPLPYLRKLHFEILEDLDRNKAVYVGRFTGKPWKRRSR